MFRYMALLWDSRSHKQTEAAALISRRLVDGGKHWQRVLDNAGLRVFCTEASGGFLRATPLCDQQGVVLGCLFERNADPEDPSPARRAALDARRSAEIIRSHGRCLMTDYWGNYVGVLDGGAGQKWVIKDPTGALPCFTVAYCGLTLAFSCIADCVGLGILDFTVNWHRLAHHILGRSLPSGATSLNEVTEVHRGECLELDGRNPPARTLYWTPTSFCADTNALIEDRQHAANAMRGTIISCTQTLASCHESILVRLSGGLDSSIILACLKNASEAPRITACTFYTPGGRADARRWAHIASRDIGCEQLDWQFNPAAVRLDALLEQQPSVQPQWAMHDLLTAPLERRCAAERRATAVLTGDGGDAGLGTISVAHCVEQYLQYHGLRPGVLRVARDASLCRDESILQILQVGLRSWLFGYADVTSRALMWGACKLVSDRAPLMAATEDEPHPWFSAHERLPLNIVRQLGDLTRTPTFYDLFVDPQVTGPVRVEPMYSQPVVELLLRIPTYVQIEGGRDRGLARRAFAGRVPAALLSRLWKDRAPQYLRQLIQNNLTFLRETLLDGVLMKEGLLKRSAVETALSTGLQKADFPEGELMCHLDAELWARHWVGTERHRAVA